MNARWLLAAVAALVVTAGSAQASIALDTSRMAVVEGEPFTFVSTLTNDGPTHWNDVTMVLSVIRLSDGMAEDPEDWDPSWSHRLPLVERGANVQLAWQIRTIKSGEFLFFITAIIPGEGGRPVASEVLQVDVGPGGAITTTRLMSVLLGVPAVLGSALVASLSARRKKS